MLKKQWSALAIAFALGCLNPSHSQAACDCTYAVLYNQNAGYSQIAVDDVYAYFGDNIGNIKKVPKAGGDVTVVATYPGNRVITGVAVDANNIYFGVVGPLPSGYSANYGDIASVPKTGGSITTLTTSAKNVIYLDVDDTCVYWDSYGTFSGASFPQKDGFIARVPKGGGAVETIVGSLESSYNFALDGSDIYFGESGYVSPASTTGALKKVAKTGGTVTTLYSGVTGYVSTDSDYVYCSSAFAGQIFRVPKAGGTRRVYLYNLTFPGQVRFRDNQLYFAVDDNAGGNGVYGVLDVNTGESQILKSGLPAAITLALDDCALYGMGKDGSQVGTVHRICRPSGAVVATTQFSLATTAVCVSETAYQASVQVNRTGDTSFAAAVTYGTFDITTTAGVDYSAFGASGSLQFAAGETSQTINITINQDTVAEPDKTFTLSLLSTSVGAALGNPTSATITILDNDRPGPGKPQSAFTADIGNQFVVTVKAAGQQSDGRIVMGGNFQTVNGTSHINLARVTSTGALDSSFDAGTGPNSDVFALAIQPDGQVVIAGQFSTVNGVSRAGCARVGSSGALDPAFAPPKLSFMPAYYGLVLQPDGKILVGGSFNFGGTNLARFNADGTLDATFAVGGGANGTLYSLALQADGKVLVAGSFTTFNGSPAANLVRLESNGTIDATFSAPILGVQYSTMVRSVIALADGRILVGGAFTNINGIVRTNVARLLTSGAVDATFAPALNFNGNITSMAVQGDGKVLIGGGFNLLGAMRVARLNTDGSQDAGFDVGGGPDGTVFQVLPLSTGDVLVGGGFTTFNEVPVNRLVMLQGAAVTPPAPAFLSCAPLAGQFRLTFSVANGATYVVQSSTDLSTWTALQTNTSSGSNITFTDADASSHPLRFYRVRIP